MGNITAGLKSVTVNCESHEVHHLLRAVRKLYVPNNKDLEANQSAELMRRFYLGYEQFKDNPKIKELFDEVQNYNKRIDALGVSDYQIKESVSLGRTRCFILGCYRFLYWLITALMALPGVVLNFPVIIVANWMASKKAKEAVKSSNVKLKGKDVLATWKLLVAVVMIPSLYLTYSIILGVSLSSVLTKSQCVLVAIGAFFIGFPVVSYFSIRFGEIGVSHLRSLKSLFKIAFGRGKSELHELYEIRERLKEDIRKAVSELGPQLYGEKFDAIRVIGKDEFELSQDDMKQPFLSP